MDEPQHDASGKNAFSRQVDSVGWAAFFIWIGVAVLGGIGWAWSLLGISAIVLSVQAALRLNQEGADPFMVACGIVLLVGAVWELLGLDWPLAPVLLIALGLVMLWNVLFRHRAG